MRIPLTKPFLPPTVIQRIQAVLESGMLTEGEVTGIFEAQCADFLGVNHCLAVTSCTVGLEAVLRCMNIGPGDEVIVPDFTYPATADAVMIVGATVVLVDIDPHMMLIDYGAVESAITDKTRAVIPVSLFGNPLDYDRLARIKSQFDVNIIEDAACAFGAEYRGAKVGGFSDLSVFSMHPRKIITTGEGGLITTNVSQWCDWLWSYKHFGMQKNSISRTAQFTMMGSNYKLSNLLAAIGLEQIKMMESILSRRRKRARRYLKLFENFSGIELPVTSPEGNHAYQSFCILIPERDRIIDELRKYDIEAQIGTYCLHRQPAFQIGPLCRWSSDFPNSASVGDRCLSLPLYYEMSDTEQDEVVARIKAL